MNATPPIFHAQRSDTQNSTPASASQPPQGGSRDFAATLRDTGTKPVRKHASHKQQANSPNGNDLPSSGNQPPPAIAPPPAGTQAPPAQTKDAAGAAAVAQAGNAAVDPKAKPGAPAAADSAPADAPPAAKAAGDAGSADAALAAADLQASTESAAAIASTVASPAAASADGAPSAAPTMPHAAGIRSLPTAGAASADPQVRAKSRDAGAGDAIPTTPASRTNTDVNSAANDPTLSNGATADADATAQAVMAAVIAQTQSAPAKDATSADDTVTPDGGISLQGMAAANDAQLPAPVAGTHAPAAPSAIAAASAAAAVQAVQGAADAGAADRHARGTGQDSLGASSADGTAGAAQLLTSNAPADAAPVPTFKVPAGVDTAAFGQGIADRVSLMMDGNLGLAKLQVNPPMLGPIEVRIALQAGHAQVSFSSHSAVTRDALESSAPKLREMLGSQGFAQVSVDISHRSFQDRAPPSHAYEASAASGDSAVKLAPSAPALRSANGLLDAYA
jgi:flagellar hook-length control protein FliK